MLHKILESLVNLLKLNLFIKKKSLELNYLQNREKYTQNLVKV